MEKGRKIDQKEVLLDGGWEVRVKKELCGGFSDMIVRVSEKLVVECGCYQVAVDTRIKQ